MKGDTQKKCMKCWVSGRVQGVGFRYSTQREAENLGLTGYALNLDDGRVEILACGDTQKIEALLNWLRAGGPRSARVEKVLVEPVSLKEEWQQFFIRY